MQTFTLYHKTILKFKELRLGFLGVADLTQSKLIKKDFFVSYLKKQVEIHLRAEQAWENPTEKWNNLSEYFTSIYLTGIYSRNFKETYGVEVIPETLRSFIILKPTN